MAGHMLNFSPKSGSVC